MSVAIHILKNFLHQLLWFHVAFPTDSPHILDADQAFDASDSFHVRWQKIAKPKMRDSLLMRATDMTKFDHALFRRKLMNLFDDLFRYCRVSESWFFNRSIFPSYFLIASRNDPTAIVQQSRICFGRLPVLSSRYLTTSATFSFNAS